MKLSKILGVILVLVPVLHGQSPESQRVHAFAQAIARTEGFYVKGSVARRFHNPGDICTSLAHGYPGQIGVTPHGYAVFASDADGWRALESNLLRIETNRSKYYNRDMTIRQIAGIYARDPSWLKNVCKFLEISPDTTFDEYVRPLTPA